MRNYLLGLMLIAGLAGCSSDTDPNPAASGPVANPAGPALADAGAAPAIPQRAPGNTVFASLPDRGELLAYGGARKSRQSGAYHYHPVALSEEHALNAIASGEMVLATPDGETLRLGYESHEEHPDGNWTWIGRNADGSSAVLTFGEKAVFGLVTRGDEQFRVRTDRTGAWVVATDRTRLAPGGARRDKPDFLPPPEDGALAAAGIRHLQKAAPRAASSVGKATAVVDVLLGYSSGLVQQLGSQSAAQTRMINLVSAANAAYANSGVNMRLRPVHALQVNYADTTDNEETLQQLTGYNASTGQPITPNSAFNALRAARDEFGADLVAFVRAYREPEQNGCGIAWLLGMNGSAIQASRDAEFGYAVISDGEDRDERDGFSYFCSDFSLAHEFGHLMGQAHNSEDAANRAGAHAYSYGYRESSATGFFTIMAYPLGEGQVEIPYFANPQVRVSGRPTGVANESDNARSMNQTMPIIATFRAAVVPLGGVRTDIDGDGKSDVIFRNVRNGLNVIWKSARYTNQQAMTGVTNQAWKIVGTGDFDGDGKADVLWRNSSTGSNVIWRSGSSSSQQAVATVSNQAWQVAGVGDFNGDGMADILWRRADTGQNVIWRSGSSAAQTAVATVVGGGWMVAAVDDFNGDGRSDILWRSTSAGRNLIWLSGNTATRQEVQTVADRNWRVAGTGDFNGDGIADVFWRHATSGANVIWLGADVNNQVAVKAAGIAWNVVAIGDYDGDGRSDVMFRHATNGSNVIWKSGNYATQQSMTAVTNVAWQVFY